MLSVTTEKRLEVSQCLPPEVSLTCDGQDLGCPHNLIYLYHHHGLREQDAYDIARQRQHELYRAWYAHRAALPIYGETQDVSVARP
jgi:hypothetical protein